MIKFISKTSLVAILFLGLAPSMSSAATTGDDPMLQYYKVNEKYACTPEELADFMAERRKSLEAAPNIMDSGEFIKTQIAQKKDDEEESCLTLFDDLEVIKKINKLIKKIQDMSMPTMPNDNLGLAAQELAKRMMDAALDSVCNALTKEAATALINEIMSREMGFDMNSSKKFDAKKFAKGLAKDHAGAYLESKGVDADWLDEENHKDLMSGEIDDQKETLKDSIFKD